MQRKTSADLHRRHHEPRRTSADHHVCVLLSSQFPIDLFFQVKAWSIHNPRVAIRDHQMPLSSPHLIAPVNESKLPHQTSFSYHPDANKTTRHLPALWPLLIFVFPFPLWFS